MTRFVLLLVLLLGSVAIEVGHAAESYVHALPLSSTSVTPGWLQIHPSNPTNDSVAASYDFVITPPDATGDLAVTFYFTEKEGGFLKLYWKGEKTAETLCDNLYENVGMPNQRTVLIPKSIVGTGGMLTILSDADTTGITKVEWNWVSQATVDVTDPLSVPALLRAGNQPLRAEEVSGDAPVPVADRVQGHAVQAIIQDEAVRIEQGADFIVNLESVPPLARIEAQLLGVPLHRNIAVWVNGVPINQLALDVPDLSDPGYIPGTTTSNPLYIGWRKGTVFIPASALRVGENRFSFNWLEIDSAETTATPLALKNFFLQLNFDAPAAPIFTPDQP